MTEEKFRQWLREKVKELGGSQEEFGFRFGFRQSQISAVINGKEKPPYRMLKALGVKKVVTYRIEK